MKKEGLEDHTKGEKKKDLGRNPSGEGEGSEGRVFGGREKKFCQGRNEKVRLDFALNLFKQNAS